MSRKRKSYFEYFEPDLDRKIPRSTKWNRSAHLRSTQLGSIEPQQQDRVVINAQLSNNVDPDIAPVNHDDGHEIIVNQIDFVNDEYEGGGDHDSDHESIGQRDFHISNAVCSVDGNGREADASNGEISNIVGPIVDDGSNYEEATIINEQQDNIDMNFDPEPNENGDIDIGNNAVYDRIITANVNITARDLLLIIYSYYDRHQLDWRAMEHAAVMVSHILGDDSIPCSKYHFKKLFCQNAEAKPIIHYNCKMCRCYLGTEEKLKSPDAPQVCEVCEEKIDLKTKYNETEFFTSIPLAPQLKSHIEKSFASGDLVFRTGNIENNNDNITDIFDAEIYRKLRRKYHGHRFVTLTVNTDGAPVFKSANKSLWPLQFYVNEINANKRFRRSNILISSIAYGKTPDMTSFLKPFIEEINNINDNGGLPILINDTVEPVFVIPLLFTLDSVAKCDVLLKKQYNGYYGCPYCYHKGTLIPVRNIRYCKEHERSLRSNKNTRDAMITACRTGQPVRGYLGVSPLIAFTDMDLVWQIPIDKMHNIDLGAIRKLFELFLDGTRNEYDWFLLSHLCRYVIQYF